MAGLRLALSQSVRVVLVGVLLLLSIPADMLAARRADDCGNWAPSDEVGGHGLTVKPVSANRDDRCQAVYRLENTTAWEALSGAIKVGGYTLEARLRKTENLDPAFHSFLVEFVQAPDNPVSGPDHTLILPSLGASLDLVARGAGTGTTDLTYGLTLTAFEWDAALFVLNQMIKQALKAMGLGAAGCTALNAPRLLALLLNNGPAALQVFGDALQLAANGQMETALDKLTEAINVFIDKAKELLFDTVRACLKVPELARNVIQQLILYFTGLKAPEFVAGVVVDLLSYMTPFVVAFLRNQKTSGITTFRYQPPATAARPSPTSPAPRATPSSPAPKEASELAYIDQGTLWLANIDGSASRQLAGGQGGPVRRPAWSPDGEHIAYIRTLGQSATSSGQQIEIMGRDGTGPVLAVKPKLNPRAAAGVQYQTFEQVRWAGDTDAIYYRWNYGTTSGKGISRVDLRTGAEQDLGVDAWAFDVTRDGTIAYITYDNAGPNAGKMSLLVRSPGGQERVLLSEAGLGTPLWSTDGQQLLLPAGRTLRLISRDGAAVGSISVPGDFQGVSWSPDGRELAIAAHQGTSAIVWTVPVTGGTPTQRFFGTDPAWRPLPSPALPSRSPTVPPTALRPTATTIQVSGPQGFLGQDNTGADPIIVFIQWTEVSGNLTGQLQLFSVDVQGKISSTNTAFTGLRSGSSVSLRLSGYGGAATNLTGTLTGNTLNLLIPDPKTGQFTPFILRAASVQDYNNATQALRQNATATAVALSANLVGIWDVQKASTEVLYFDNWVAYRLEFTKTGEVKYTYTIFDPVRGNREGTSTGRYAVSGTYIEFQSERGSSWSRYSYALDGDTLRLKEEASPSAPYTIVFKRLSPTRSAEPISVGSTVIVTGAGDCLNVRATPSKTARIVNCLPDGTRATILDGPRSADGSTWFLLDAGGWAVADYLRPASSQSVAPSPGPSSVEQRLTRLLGVKSGQFVSLADGPDGTERVAALVGVTASASRAEFDAAMEVCRKYGQAGSPCLLLVRLGSPGDAVLHGQRPAFYWASEAVNFCGAATRLVIDYPLGNQVVPYRATYRLSQDRLVLEKEEMIGPAGKPPPKLPCSEILR